MMRRELSAARPMVPVLCSLLVGLACTGSGGESGRPGDARPGDPGAKGEPGDPQAPSISAVTPNEVFLARTMDVTLSGFGTDWSEDTTVVFDTESAPDEVDIEVLGVRWASPTALVATIRTDADTAVGLRTVSVVQGEQYLVLEGGFNVLGSLEVLGAGSFGGTASRQGSVWQAWVIQRDPSTPFHPRLNKVWIEGGWDIFFPSENGHTLLVALTVDVFATPGPASFFVDSGPPDTPLLSVAPGAVDVQESLPQVVTTSEVALTLATFESKLLAIDLQAGQLANIELSPAANTPPTFLYFAAALPPSGRWKHNLAFKRASEAGLRPVQQIFAPQAGRYFLSITKSGFETAFDLGVSIQKQAAVPTALTLATGTPLTLLRETLFGLDADVFSFEANEGQRIKIDLGAGSADACGPVGAINADAELTDAEGNQVAFGVVTEDNFCPEVRVSAPKTGTYYLRVAPTQKTVFQLFPLQWPCVPLDVTQCLFDYAVTVEVDD